MTAAPYARIVAELRDQISTGQLRPGDRVPSTRQITREWGVAIATATKVLTALRQEGLVRAVPGIGTVVADPPPARPARRREHELTVDRLVRQAITIADTEGLGALSMRRVAMELGVATMSLYSHVSGKDELVVLMADAVFAEYPPPDLTAAGWRAQLEALARLQWAGYRHHPWLAQVISVTRPHPFPHGMMHTEWALHALDDLGLDLNAMLHAAVTLFRYVSGVAINFEAEIQAEQDTGLTAEEWIRARDAQLSAVLSRGDFPVLSRVVVAPDIDVNLDSIFEFGLARLLDGLAVMIDRMGGDPLA